MDNFFDINDDGEEYLPDKTFDLLCEYIGDKYDIEEFIYDLLEWHGLNYSLEEPSSDEDEDLEFVEADGFFSIH